MGSTDPQRAIEEARRLRAEVVDKVTALATAAFGLVAALAWNSAIQEAFKRYFPTGGSQMTALLGYALVVTLIAVLVTIWLGRIAGGLRGRSPQAPSGPR